MGSLGQASTSTAEEWSNWASAFQSITAGLAIIIGAIWAYLRFFKDRIYRPRIEMMLDGGFIEADGNRRLICALTLRNIGGTKVRLVKSGTGLKVTLPQPSTNDRKPMSSQRWDHANEVVFSVFEQHDWIESHETIRDEVLLAPFLNPNDVYR